jgi:hypothetical protein
LRRRDRALAGLHRSAGRPDGAGWSFEEGGRRPSGARRGRRGSEAAAHGRRIQATESDRFAANVLPVIASLQAAGMRGLAAALNSRGIPTARGGNWHVSNVGNVLARLCDDRVVL